MHRGVLIRPMKVRVDQREELEHHPLSKLIDPMTDQECEALKANTDEHGLADPRIYRYEGKPAGISRNLEVVEFDPQVDGHPAKFILSISPTTLAGASAVDDLPP
jgi:hypothetical protein